MLAALTLSAAATAAFAAPVPDNIAAALADPARPAADKARDEARKPGEMLALAGVPVGGKVADFIIGGGYFTRILADAVGAGGVVYAYQPAEFIAFNAAYGENLKTVAAAYANVKPMDGSFAMFALPEGLDLVLTVQNYHDLHLKPFPADTASKINAQIFKALKPGGAFLVVDHEAAEGSTLEVADSLHRITPAAVKAEVEAAGFKLESESKLLDNPADPHTASVFDASIKGKTDQFILVFRKPK